MVVKVGKNYADCYFFLKSENMEEGGGERRRRKRLPANPLQNAFAHKRRALIGADGTDVRQLLVNMHYQTKSQGSCRHDCLNF